MKEKNKILLLLILFAIFVSLLIELTSPTSLYRDPYMYRHFSAAEFISEKNKLDTVGEYLDKYTFFGWDFLSTEKQKRFFFFNQYFTSKSLIFFPLPVLSSVLFSFSSGISPFFIFNHFFFLIFITVLSFFILFREIFHDNWLAFSLSLIVLLFSFEPIYYKITLHGWYFIRIFSAISLYFMVKFLKQKSSFKSKNFFFILFFSVLGIYSDKSAFMIVLLPLILFFIVYFFFEKGKINVKKRFLNYFVLVFLVLLVFSFFNIFNQIAWNINVIIYNLQNFNLVPSFLLPKLPFSEYYLKKDFLYLLIRYLIPSIIVFSLIFLNFSKLKEFLSTNSLIKSFFVSQIIFYLIVAFSMLFSFAFISSRGASMIFFFLCVLSLISLNQMKSIAKRSLIAVFFLFVLILPLLFFTQTPQFKYEQFNQKHLSAIEWIDSFLDNDSRIYSDIKMAKAVAIKTKSAGLNPSSEFGYSMEKEIIPIYFDANTQMALERFVSYEATHLLLTKEMSSLTVQPANELLKPATALSQFDSSDSFNKIFENKQVRVYGFESQ